MIKRGGFTLLEIIVVIIIIALLSVLAFSHYGSEKERTLDREVFINLGFIRRAQRMHMAETDSYYPASSNVSDIPSINQNLSLMLSNETARYWNYTVWNTGCGRATRIGSNGRSWYWNVTDEQPAYGAGCP